MTTHPPSSSQASPGGPETRADADLEAALSADRYARYLDWAGGDHGRAVELYTLNAQVCEALYIPLNALEVALRNRIDAVLTAAHGRRWFEDAAVVTSDRQRQQVVDAAAKLAEEDKPDEPGRVVAALTFSFWTSFFGKTYDDAWRTTLNRIARRPDGRGLSRKDFARPCTQLRFLRNRVAHHEPVIYWDLPKHHTRLGELTLWLSPALARWATALDRFPQVHPAARLALAKTASPPSLKVDDDADRA